MTRRRYRHRQPIVPKPPLPAEPYEDRLARIIRGLKAGTSTDFKQECVLFVQEQAAKIVRLEHELLEAWDDVSDQRSAFRGGH